MNVMPAKIAAKSKRFVNGQVCQVLRSESNHRALCDEKGQLIFSRGCEAAELNATDDRAYGGGQVVFLDVGV